MRSSSWVKTSWTAVHPRELTSRDRDIRTWFKESAFHESKKWCMTATDRQEIHQRQNDSKRKKPQYYKKHLSYDYIYLSLIITFLWSVSSYFQAFYYLLGRDIFIIWLFGEPKSYLELFVHLARQKLNLLRNATYVRDRLIS